MIAKDYTERLSAVALSVGLIIPRGKCVSGDVSQRVFFSSDTPLRYLDRDCVGRRRTGTRHGNVYRSVKENRELLFTGNVFYKQWHLCVLFHYYFEAQPPENLKY